ncbi:MAG: hypothetical protein FWC38_09510 [Proteobacteria bacterium]|nr:hypothetical protein [Pseudomonadota bacterium]MCL2308434.1 hypothetical protein [Pseudomonadota bacterium]
MSILLEIFLGGILQFIISTILVFYFLNSEGSDDRWWKVNPEVDPVSTWGMYFFFIGLTFVIGAMIFDLPIVWRGLKSSLAASLIVTLLGLNVFIIGKYNARKKARADKAEGRNPPQ